MGTMTYTPIATTTLGSAASSITFSSIPSTYTDLRVVFVGQTQTSAQTVYTQFNSDTATNYSNTVISGNGSTAASYRNTSNNNIEGAKRALIPISPNWGLYTFDIFSYAGSTYKTCLITANGDANGSGRVDYNVGLWRSTSAITSVKLFNTNNWATGTTATLYGLKSA